MADDPRADDDMPDKLREESRDTRCLYLIEEMMNRPDANIDRVCRGIVQVLPQGFRNPGACQIRIVIENRAYQSTNFRETPRHLESDVIVQGRAIGALRVYCGGRDPGGAELKFMPEESRLIEMVAQRLSQFIMYRQLKREVEARAAAGVEPTPRIGEWHVVLDLLKQTDRLLYFNISHKMLNHLCWSGFPEADALRREAQMVGEQDERNLDRDPNRPHTIMSLRFSNGMVDEIFKVAAQRLNDQEILSRIQRWIQEDKLGKLSQVANRNLPLTEVADVVRRYQQLESEGVELFSPSIRGIKVSLIRRFLSDQLPFINIAKNYVEVGDFFNILQKTIYSSESYGRLGGKSAGLFLAAKVLKSATEHASVLGNIRIPRTWYITSDMMYSFMDYNNFGDIIEQKYKDRDQIRYEYPFIVQTFKNAPFPPEMVKGISVALDEFEERPLIVRSSSLLEDSVGAVFSGKYKSLFLTNQGTKKERLAALLDAIAEVYASVFSSDPIEYRAERGLLDFAEEMGIMIQEVVGTRVGRYYMPVCAGVAFSHNEFRWSPRIRQRDGLLRMVLGLGTRAVDRVSDDYPVLIAPGQPNLRVNASVDEVLRYAPKYADVINLENNCFETVPIAALLREVGAELPGLERLVSVVSDDHLRPPMGHNINPAADDLVITFEGLIKEAGFITQVQTILKVLEERLDMPVDIEFAHDGRDFYLLQCRSQSHSEQSLPSPIPRDLPEESIIFTARRNVTNGRIPDITHVVYVDPTRYGEVQDNATLLQIGQVVGRLNKLLPRRSFILMGPGRWGSRGDIRLGVSVGYADINNTAMLIEIARRTGQYVPDLSFGTHFFQDLVESNIRYLPLYPDDQGSVFREDFLLGSHNLLGELLPDHAHLAEIVRVIDIPASADGQILRILLNADLDEAVGVLMAPSPVSKSGRSR